MYTVDIQYYNYNRETSGNKKYLIEISITQWIFNMIEPQKHILFAFLVLILLEKSIWGCVTGLSSNIFRTKAIFSWDGSTYLLEVLAPLQLANLLLLLLTPSISGHSTLLRVCLDMGGTVYFFNFQEAKTSKSTLI